jgi:hypothetical protein
MATAGVLAAQSGAVVETPFSADAAAGGYGVLRLRGCFAKREAVASLRMTGADVGSSKRSSTSSTLVEPVA